MVVAQWINLGTELLDPWGWRLSLALAGIPAIVLTIGGLTLPETPNSLIERGKVICRTSKSMCTGVVETLFLWTINAS